MKKKSKDNKWQKIGLGLLIVASIASVKLAFFPNVNLIPEQEQAPVEKKEEPTEKAVRKVYANVFFIGHNDSNEEVYRAVKRIYDEEKDGSKLKFAIENLLKGPTKQEKSKGVYTEIPQGTKLLSLEETPEKASVNLSAEFEYGGGTDGLYKRLYQLIKTVNKNSNTSVYLYINGKQAEVIGGEGLMINQPLNERSLDE